MKGWLDKYTKAQNGIEGTMGGLTDKGFNYSPAWGGQFAMGGNIPGSVGFTYARTGDIPSNGKYGKKTLASAQNGMQFYQEGLDFQPRTISQKGTIIPLDDRPNTDNTYVRVKPRPLTKAEYEENQRISQAQKEGTEKKKQEVLAQRKKARETKGTIQEKNFNIGEKFRLFPGSVGGAGELFDDFLNPLKFVGDMASNIGNSSTPEELALNIALTAGAGAVGFDPLGSALKSPALKNAYKLNPWAFKPQEGMMYRGIGKEGMEDALESKVFRASPYHSSYNSNSGLGQTRFTENAYYSPELNIAKIYNKDYIAEVPRSSGIWNVEDVKVPIQFSTKNIPISEGRILKKDWLKGYKEVPKPTSNFKSEIDWGKWNPDTPKYPELVNEYNAIEKSTKKAGTWMKNPDGSAFQGTPEQFIQQQSSYFKKAFPNVLRDEAGNIQKTYHGSQNTFDFFDPNIMMTGRTRGKGIYTSPFKERAASYATKGDKKIYELYQNANKQQDIVEQFNKASDQRFKDFLEKNPKGSKDFDKKFDEFMKKEDELYSLTDEDFNLQQNYDFLKASPDEYVVPFTNYPKSAVGNVGFFDMNNPNIYKALVPAVAGGASAFGMAPLEKKKQGGVIKDDRGQWAHPGEITQIDSNDITMQGVNYPVMGIGADGQRIVMEPGKNYKFNQAPVTEIPMAQNGMRQEQKGLQNLEDLTNFTNYNKPTKGGWLSKYE